MLSPESLEQHCLINENTSKVIQESEYTLREVLVKLRNGGPGDGKIVCPPSMSAKDRRRAHEIAERLGLGHVRCVFLVLVVVSEHLYSSFYRKNLLILRQTGTVR